MIGKFMVGAMVLVLSMPALVRAQVGFYISSEYKQIPGQNIDNIPASMRTIPIHKDDSSVYKLRTIPYDNIDVESLPLYNFGFGLNLSLTKDIVISLGGFLIPQEGYESSSNIREWNEFYDDDLRGFNRALVYYKVTSYPEKFGYLARVEIGATKRVALLLNYSMTRVNYTFENGWDRYDELEIYQSYKSRAKIHQPSIGLKVHVIGEFGDRPGGGMSIYAYGGPIYQDAITIKDLVIGNKQRGWAYGAGFEWSVIR